MANTSENDLSFCVCCMLHSMHLYTHVPLAQGTHNPYTKDVPKELMISSTSLRLLHSVGEGTYFTPAFCSLANWL